MHFSTSLAVLALATPSLARPSVPELTSAPRIERRQVLEGAALVAAAVDLLGQTVVGACFTDCGAFTAVVVIGCPAQAVLPGPEHTMEACVCSAENLVLWDECASCIVNNLDDKTQRPAKMAAIKDSYSASCHTDLNLVDTTSSSSLPVYTDPGTGIPESLTRTTASASSVASASSAVGPAVEAHPDRGPPSSSINSTPSASSSTSVLPAAPPSSTSPNALTVTSTAEMVTVTSNLPEAPTSAEAAAASSSPVSAGTGQSLGARSSALVASMFLIVGLIAR